MRYGSVCSGIEAATVAWHDLGWTPAWFSEIEPFPCAVLAHHYPTVPNLGDMTTIRHRIAAGEVEAPDLLVGGTPCQSFSVAGLRGGLDDERGNLALEFVRLADAIDAARLSRGLAPAWILWENVPGAFTVDRGGAFGSILGALVGDDAPLLPPGELGWTDAGVATGPRRTAAWRVLDAQFFGLAQRRRRVFVLARGGPRGWAAADALLPLLPRLRRHPAPRRAAGEGTAGGAAAGIGVGGDLAHTLKAEGFDGSEDGTGRGAPLVTSQISEVAHCICGGPDGRQFGSGRDGQDTFIPVAQPIPFDTTQITHPENRSKCEPGSPAPSLAKAGHPPAIAYSFSPGREGCGDQAKDDLFIAEQDTARTLTANCGADPSNHQGGMAVIQPAIAFPANFSNQGIEEGLSPTLAAETPTAIAFHVKQDPISSPHVSAPVECGCGTLGVATPISFYATAGTHGVDARENIANTLKVGAGGSGGYANGIAQGMAVRRLTPRECERLQGFPDDYTLIPIGEVRTVEEASQRLKMAKDGPRYRALGNSMATKVMRHIGRAIQREEDR